MRYAVYALFPTLRSLYTRQLILQFPLLGAALRGRGGFSHRFRKKRDQESRRIAKHQAKSTKLCFCYLPTVNVHTFSVSRVQALAFSIVANVSAICFGLNLAAPATIDVTSLTKSSSLCSLV